MSHAWALSLPARLQVEVLSTILREFYDRHEESDGVVAYARSDQQRTLLLLHILILALALDRYSLSNLQTEALRTSLKITPAQFSTLYRSSNLPFPRNAARLLWGYLCG